MGEGRGPSDGDALHERVVRLFRDFFAPPPASGPPLGARLDRLHFSLHLVVGSGAIELFPPGLLDPFRFYQRHHASLHHELEYVACVPAGADKEAYRPYALVRLRPEERLPLVDLNELERDLQRSYGTFIHLPRARPLLERQYSQNLNDEDPPEGLNRVRAPSSERPVPGRLTVKETLEIMGKELTGPERIAWLEGAFRQPPERGRAEHRYYLDPTGRLYVVRDHWAEGKTLYRAESSASALRPERP